MVWSKVSEWADPWQTLTLKRERGGFEGKRAPASSRPLFKLGCAIGFYFFELLLVCAILNAHAGRHKMMRLALPHRRPEH